MTDQPQLDWRKRSSYTWNMISQHFEPVMEKQKHFQLIQIGGLLLPKILTQPDVSDLFPLWALRTSKAQAANFALSSEVKYLGAGRATVMCLRVTAFWFVFFVLCCCCHVDPMCCFLMLFDIFCCCVAVVCAVCRLFCFCCCFVCSP